MRQLSSWRAGVVLCALLIVQVSGCTKPPAAPPPHPQPQLPGPPAPQVAGSVEFEGAPVVAGRVELYKEKEEPVFASPIFSDGTFEIRGLEEGDYRAALKLGGIP